jgi:RNA polymerase sigma factor (sigma-70 family)
MNTPYIPTIDDLRMQRLAENDPGAFEEIVSDWQRPLFGFFFRNTRDEHLSEDLVQETLLRLHRNKWDYLPRGLFKGFLFRIARNLLIDHSRRAVHDVLIRRIQARAAEGDEDAPDLMTLVPDDLLSPEGKANVHDALLRLPDIVRRRSRDGDKPAHGKKSTSTRSREIEIPAYLPRISRRVLFRKRVILRLILFVPNSLT